SATSAPASNASIAARMPAQPAPTMRTSCLASTTEEATQTAAPDAVPYGLLILSVKLAARRNRETRIRSERAPQTRQAATFPPALVHVLRATTVRPAAETSATSLDAPLLT